MSMRASTLKSGSYKSDVFLADEDKDVTTRWEK
jgi:hypothetical protein